ncbi:hypothetical protein ACVOMV_28125 [Mesorhizobium atlanticum]
MSSLRVKVISAAGRRPRHAEPSALIADGGNRSTTFIACVPTSAGGSPVKSEGIAKALLSPPAATLTGMLVTVEAGGGTAEAYAPMPATNSAS